MLTLFSISETFISIGLWMVAGIYKIAAWAFEIFLVLASANVVEGSEYQKLIENSYVIIGIVMLFAIAFALLRGMVNPEDQKGGTSKMRQILINLITSSIILVLLPTIFSFALDFQKSILSNNVIGKFFGYGGNTSEGNVDGIEYVRQGAYHISNGVFTAFFTPSEDSCTGTSLSDVQECQDAIHTKESNDFGGSLLGAINYVDNSGKFLSYAKFSKNADNGEIDFNFLLALLAGGLLVYVAVSFCFDMGVRLVKLVFYQVIAPIPVFLRIIPDTKMSESFNSWIKVTLACYLEVFVRILVFYFSVYICTLILNNTGSFGQYLNQHDFFIAIFARAFVLMGIIMFMKQAPKLFSDITGIDTGNMKLGIKDKLADSGVFTAGAAIGGGITGGVRNAVNAWKKGEGIKGIGSALAGGASGFVRGAAAGRGAKSFADMKKSASSGAKAATDARDKRAANMRRYTADKRNYGEGKIYDLVGGFKDWAGGGADAYNETIAAADSMTSLYEKIESESKEIYKKYSNNVGLKVEMSEDMFKGSPEQKAELKRLYDSYDGMSMAAMEKDLEALRGLDPNNLVSKDQFTKKDGNGNIVSFDEKGYIEAAELARKEHVKKVANLDSMINQTKKETLLRIQAGATGEFDLHASENGGVSEADMANIKAAASEFDERFRMFGSDVKDPIESKNNRNNIGNAADRKAVSDAYKNIGNKARQDSAKVRQQAEQRKGNSNN